jgi:hypothetical protein
MMDIVRILLQITEKLLVALFRVTFEAAKLLGKLIVELFRSWQDSQQGRVPKRPGKRKKQQRPPTRQQHRRPPRRRYH